MIIGSGIDMVEIRRIQHAMDRYGKRFLNRVYTATEQAYCMRKRNAAESFAARFAAKEAGAKAGIVLNPGTPVESLTDLIGCFDYALLMSVYNIAVFAISMPIGSHLYELPHSIWYHSLSRLIWLNTGTSLFAFVLSRGCRASCSTAEMAKCPRHTPLERSKLCQMAQLALRFLR